MAKKAIVHERLDKAKVKQLYAKSGNVQTVAKTLGASYMGVRRNLIAQGVELVPVRANRAVVHSKLNGKQIEVIARSVATAILGKATVQLQPQTREAMWGNIHRGVQQGMKRIGFHP